MTGQPAIMKNDQDGTVKKLDTTTRQIAAEWAVRLDDRTPLSDAEQTQLQDWLAAHSQHAEALAFARQTWGTLASASPAHAFKPAQPVARRRYRKPLKALAVAASVALVVLSIKPAYQASMPLWADYSTGTGEVSRVQLPDGTLVTLDSNSAISLDYGASRHVRLLRGEAVFDVAPVAGSESRPFVVSSQGVSSRALGTRFVVSQRGQEGGWVGVQEHAISLDGRTQRLVLEAGESAHIYPDGSFSPVEINLSRATSWQRGLLVFERAPLSQVVSELNRYRKGHIIISRGGLSEREVSGVFRLDSLDAALVSLGSELGIRQRQMAGVTLLY